MRSIIDFNLKLIVLTKNYDLHLVSYKIGCVRRKHKISLNNFLVMQHFFFFTEDKGYEIP